MNKETKIKLIQKAIEDKTGEICHTLEREKYVEFWVNEGMYIFEQTLPMQFLQMLPLSDPLEEQPDKGWIPVKVRKPQEREKVMIHVSENNSVLIAYLDERKKWRLYWDSTTINLDVTHWQPLPNPPSAPVKQG